MTTTLNVAAGGKVWTPKPAPVKRNQRLSIIAGILCGALLILLGSNVFVGIFENITYKYSASETSNTLIIKGAAPTFSQTTLSISIVLFFMVLIVMLLVSDTSKTELGRIALFIATAGCFLGFILSMGFSLQNTFTNTTEAEDWIKKQTIDSSAPVSNPTTYTYNAELKNGDFLEIKGTFAEAEDGTLKMTYVSTTFTEDKN